MAEMTQPQGSSTLDLTDFDDHQYHELDLVNIARLGRQWLGESFHIKQEQEFEFDFPNIDTSTPIKITATAASAAYTPTSFQVSANGQTIGNISFPAINSNSDTQFNVGYLPSKSSLNCSEKVKINLT